MADNIEHIAESMLVSLWDRVSYMNDPNRIRFTSVEGAKLKHSWHTYVEGSHLIDRGVELLLRLFESEPETRNWFNFDAGDAAEQMKTSRKLFFLAHRAIKFLDEVIQNVNTLDDVYPAVKQLGGRHGKKGYDVPMKYINALGGLMLEAIKTQQKADWSEEKEELWTRCLTFLSKSMEEGKTAYGGSNLLV